MKNINLAPFVEEHFTAHTATIQATAWPQYQTATFTLKNTVFNHDSGMGRNAKQQYILSQREIMKRVSGYTKNMIIVAELTKNGNIHFHGLMEFKNDLSKDLLIDDLKGNRYIGHTLIQNANNENHYEKFKEYLLKDYIKTLTIVNKNTKHIDDVIDIFTAYSLKVKIVSDETMRRVRNPAWTLMEEGDSPDDIDVLDFGPASRQSDYINIIKEYINN